ncbi:MAG: hypothetical protein JRE58_08835 [Deltaproteobacteria bacterium]|nr:hypothetical protein [Deltaproteobacteria bacterium]
MQDKKAYNLEISGEMYKKSYAQQRLFKFGVTMMVMGGSFFLYFLGLFGNVEGPLEPEKLGNFLADLGVSQTHIMIMFLFIMIVSITWNHVFNLVNLLIGARLTCTCSNADGRQCNAPVRRVKTADRKTGTRIVRYVCEHGHKSNEAHFNAVKKGPVSHSIWIASLIFLGIVFFLS